ncbi:MAG: glycogen synthase GlgA [Pseudolabrys sp.]|nr:glycogen synthase GlgA [Pseudolabrys sp.]
MSLRILFATPEFEDFIQVGGLGAVAAALPRAMRKRADVRIILPGYRAVLRQLSAHEIIGHCPAQAQMPACDIARTTTADGLPVYVVICPELYERDGGPYTDTLNRDWADNDVRFGRFALAAAALASGAVDRNWSADVVHANDWPTALIPAYLAWQGSRIPTVLTIHNLAYQGLFPKQTLGRIGAPDSSFQMDGVEFYGKVSFLKAGLVYASHLTTVSETYAQEITTSEFGCGLEGLLAKRSHTGELTGILNGIDETWDPRTCPEVLEPFGAGDWNARSRNGDHVRKQFGLALSRGPLFGLVARLVYQKGVDLVLATAETIMASGGQIVIMGRGEPQFEQALSEAQKRRPKDMGVALRFDDADARMIFAGTDFTLMPSRYEPCGLSQMYAQRFGSLPIARRTGGLAETIADDKTGFLFRESSSESFLGGICRAFAAFGEKSRLNVMRSGAMAKSYSWTNSVTGYRSVYEKVMAA